MERRGLDFTGGTAQTSGKKFLEVLTSVLFRFLVPERLERMRGRNVRLPTLFLELLHKAQQCLHDRVLNCLQYRVLF